MFGYWGKFHKFNDEDEPRKLWIGPMSRDQMMDSFPEFRHNFMESQQADSVNPNCDDCEDTRNMTKKFTPPRLGDLW